MNRCDALGLVLIEVTIVFFIGAIVILQGIKFAMNFSDSRIQQLDIDSFVHDVFESMTTYYYDDVNTTRCLKSAPSSSPTISSLISNQNLDSSYSQSQWYSPSSATLSFLTSSSGLLYGMQISLPQTSYAKGFPYNNSKYYAGEDSSSNAIYKKDLDLKINESNWLYLDTSFCE